MALITFIYAIIGMTIFGHVKHQGAVDDLVNFETFGRSMQLLFRFVEESFIQVLLTFIRERGESDFSNRIASFNPSPRRNFIGNS